MGRRRQGQGVAEGVRAGEGVGVVGVEVSKNNENTKNLQEQGFSR